MKKVERQECTHKAKSKILDQNQVSAAFEASNHEDDMEEYLREKEIEREREKKGGKGEHRKSENDNDCGNKNKRNECLSTSSAYQDPNASQKLFLPTNDHTKNTTSTFISLNPSVQRTDGDQISSFKKINRNGIEILEKIVGPGKCFCEKVLAKGTCVLYFVTVMILRRNLTLLLRIK